MFGAVTFLHVGWRSRGIGCGVASGTGVGNMSEIDFLNSGTPATLLKCRLLARLGLTVMKLFMICLMTQESI